VIVQLGGQTPLKLTRPLRRQACRILGTSPDAIDIAEDRRDSRRSRASWNQAAGNGTATSVDEAPMSRRVSATRARAAVLRAWRPRDADRVRRAVAADYFETAATGVGGTPVLIDSFLEDAFEATSTPFRRQRVVIGGVMQHIEDAGIHSGDSACVLPPYP
jgi:carbamoyl-phosphate synthase large subunit